MAKLGVNIDHVATLRQARGGVEPDPVQAALVAEKAGCHSIVAHLREDRRHINDSDIKRLKREIKTLLNLEMSVSEEIVRIAGDVKPFQATLVPEKRQELTTEGGLDVIRHRRKVSDAAEYLQSKGINVSLFIDPDERQIRASAGIGVKIVEIHTGRYANASGVKNIRRELSAIAGSVEFALSLGLVVNVGHGLNYDNVSGVADIDGIYEFNIGHSIVSHAVFSGMRSAVREMLGRMK